VKVVAWVVGEGENNNTRAASTVLASLKLAVIFPSGGVDTRR